MTHFTYQQGRLARFQSIRSLRSGLHRGGLSRHSSGLRLLATAGGQR